MAAFGLSMWGHVNAFVYDHTSKVLGLASSHTGIWVLFGWRAEFYSVEQILWYQTESGETYLILLAPLALYKRGPSLSTHYLLKAWARPQLAILTEYEVCVNMCKRSNYVWLCKSTNRNWWSPRQGSMWSPPELRYNGWNGLNSLKRWVGLPKGTVRGYPFGSWSLPMIWKLCCKLWLWHNMRICCIGYLQVMRLYNNDMIWEWKYFNLLTSISNRDSFWCDSIICYDVEW